MSWGRPKCASIRRPSRASRTTCASVSAGCFCRPGSIACSHVPPAGEESRGDGSPWLVASLVSFGVGGAAVIATAITGVMALSSDADAESLCAAPRQAGCQQAVDDTEALLVPNLALWIVSGAAVGAGTLFLVLHASEGPAETSTGRVELRFAPTSARVVGSF